jgi:prepilin-type N-terminal cleavage/methylation domain-containing protein
MLHAILERLEVAKSRDAGLTLIELLIVMFLTGIVSTIVLFSMKGVYAGQRTADNEATGLSDVRTVNERLGRDLRDAREVYQGATQSQLVLWIDYNSNYIVDSNEIVTWQLQSTCSGCHYHVLRSEQGGVTTTEARTLVSNIAFCYSANVDTDPPPCLATPLTTASAATAKVVTVTVTYNAADSNVTDHRTRETTFTERLRNVP